MKSMYRTCWGFVVGFVGMLALLYFAGVFISWEWNISTWMDVYRGLMITFAFIGGIICAIMVNMNHD